MTEEEYEQKAEEYKKKLITENKSLIPNEILYLSPIKQAYKDGYKQGQESMLFEFALEDRGKLLQKIEELKAQLQEREKIQELDDKIVQDLRDQNADLEYKLKCRDDELAEVKALLKKLKTCCSCTHSIFTGTNFLECYKHNKQVEFSSRCNDWSE